MPMSKPFFSRIKGTIRLSLIVVIASGVIFGYGTGITGYSKESLVKSKIIGESNSDKLIYSSSIVLGAFLGGISAGVFSDMLGRKPMLIAGTVVSVIGTAVSMVGINLLVVSTGRLLTGVAIGILSSIAPLYLAETSPNDLRGVLGVFFQFAITFSIFLGSISAFFTAAEDAWRIMFGLTFIPIAALAVVLFFIPESPRYLVGIDNDRARTLFADIYTLGEDIEEEISKIEISKQNEARWKDILSETNIKPVLLGILMAVAQQLTGINIIIYYFDVIAKVLWTDANAIAAAAVCLMGWNFITSMASIPLTGKVKRKKLLLTGQSVMAVSLAVAGTGLFLSNSTGTIISIIGIAAFIAGFEISVGPLFFVIINEIFLEGHRGKIGSFMNGVQWLFNFALTASFLPLVEVIGVNGVGSMFFVFMGIAIVTTILIKIYLPETKGKSFDQIQNELRGNKKGKAMPENKDVEKNVIADSKNENQETDQ